MSDIVERAEERLSVSRLGKSSHRETDKDLVVIDDLLAEVKQLEGEVFAWRMRNHKLADEVKRLTPHHIETAETPTAERDAALATLAQVRELHEEYAVHPAHEDGYEMWQALGRILDRGPR